jgi:hypothetical protein
MSPSLIGMLTDNRNRELRGVSAGRRPPLPQGILERRTASAILRLSSTLRRR